MITNICSIYTAEFTKEYNGHSIANTVELDRYACYGAWLGLLNEETCVMKDMKSSIYINKNVDVLLTGERWSNYTWCSLEQIQAWLDIIAEAANHPSLGNTNVRLTVQEIDAMPIDEDDDEHIIPECFQNTPIYEVKFAADKLSKMSFRFITTAIRYLYEWPYHYYLAHAFKLKEQLYYRRKSLFWLVTFIESMSYSGGSHSFGFSSGNLVPCDISKVIAKIPTNNRVNNLFEYSAQYKTYLRNQGITSVPSRRNPGREDLDLLLGSPQKTLRSHPYYKPFIKALLKYVPN